MPTLNEILARDARFRNQLLGLPDNQDSAEGLAARMPAMAPSPPPETPAVGGPSMEYPDAAPQAPPAVSPTPEPAPTPAPVPEPPPAPAPDTGTEVSPIGEPLQGGDAVDTPPDVVDGPAPKGPEPTDPLMAAVARLIATKAAKHGAGGSGPDDDHRAATAGEAIYRGFMRQPLSDDYFKRAQGAEKPGKDTDPLALLKFMADERERKWGHNYKESGQEAKEQAKALDQLLRERGLVTGEKRLEQNDEHYKDTADRKDSQFQVSTKLKELGMDAHQAEEQSKRIDKYRESTKGLQDVDASLAAINDILPGGIPNDSAQITKLIDSGNGFNVIDRLKNKIPLGLGTWLDQPDNKEKLQQEYLHLQDIFRHPITGSNFTKNEMDIVQQEFGNRVLENPRAMYLAIQYMRDVTGRKIQQAEASTRLGVSPLTWQLYEQSGGLTSNNPMYGTGRKTLDNVEDPTKSPIRNTATGNVPTVTTTDRRSVQGPGEGPSLKINKPVTDPSGEVIDPMTATAKAPSRAETMQRGGYYKFYDPTHDVTFTYVTTGGGKMGTKVRVEKGNTEKEPIPEDTH